MIETRPIRSDDESFLFELYADTRSAEVAAWGWPPPMRAAFLRMQWEAQVRSYAVQFPTADQRIIVYQGGAIGRIIVARAERAISLVDISLLAAFRNRGIGTALLQELQGEARQSGKCLRLSVLKSNPARNLYARLGFTPVADDGLREQMQWGSQAPDLADSDN